MGWSRYAQGVKHMVLNSGLFYVKVWGRAAWVWVRWGGGGKGASVRVRMLAAAAPTPRTRTTGSSHPPTRRALPAGL